MFRLQYGCQHRIVFVQENASENVTCIVVVIFYQTFYQLHHKTWFCLIIVHVLLLFRATRYPITTYPTSKCSRQVLIHQMETFCALLTLCKGNPPVTGGFSLKRPVTRSFDIFFDMRPKQTAEQTIDRRFEKPLRSLWRHSNDISGCLFSTQKRHPIAPQWGWGTCIWCLLWVHSLDNVSLFFFSCCDCYRVIFDRVLSRVYDICMGQHSVWGRLLFGLIYRQPTI